MQADLSYYSHTIECNFLIERLQRCYIDHPFGKFFAYCDKEANDVALCCHAERVLKRKNNPRYSPRPEGSQCLPENSYTSTLKKLKEEGVLIIRPEDCEQRRFRWPEIS
ncbi:COX assembly mitochondrial protein [Dirofilaria immitis]